jgi:hypothetical protein
MNKLFVQNQLAIAGYPQTVGVPIVLDQYLSGTCKQCPRRENGE